MKNRPKHIIEYALLRLIGAIVNALPYRAALCIGAGIAWLSFYVFRFRVAEAKRRIHLVFDDKIPDSEINRIAWISWRNIIFNAVEILRIARATPDWVAKHYDAEPFLSKIESHSKTGSGAIVAFPHMGNWELASVPCCQRKLPFFSIAAKQRNMLVNEYFNRLRGSHGLETIIRGGSTMKSVIDNLNAGKLLAILPDSRMRTADMEIPFLGGTANLGKGTAFFAKKTGLPIFPCVCTRIGWTKHRIETLDPIMPDNNMETREDIERITRSLIKLLEQKILAQPEQWFWFNKRWVLDPVDPSSLATSPLPLQKP